MSMTPYKFVERPREVAAVSGFYHRAECSDCRYKSNICGEGSASGWHCGYMLTTGRKRGCPPGKDCTHHRTVGKKPRRNDDAQRISIAQAQAARQQIEQSQAAAHYDQCTAQNEKRAKTNE